jgi:hypothetical protein
MLEAGNAWTSDGSIVRLPVIVWVTLLGVIDDELAPEFTEKKRSIIFCGVF